MQHSMPTTPSTTTFSESSGVVNSISGGGEYIETITFTSDHKILAVGDTFQNGGGVTQDFGVIRYNANSSLDTTFGSGGVAVFRSL